MPNLTGVEPYLYSLHSRFCFKGFVYTRPINHLLPFHSPTAFKVGARPGDNVQHRCQCKSLFLLFLRKEMKIPRPLVTFSSQVSLLSLLYSALGLDHNLNISLQLGLREFWLPNLHTLHTWAPGAWHLSLSGPPVPHYTIKFSPDSWLTLSSCLDSQVWAYADRILLSKH